MCMRRGRNTHVGRQAGRYTHARQEYEWQARTLMLVDWQQPEASPEEMRGTGSALKSGAHLVRSRLAARKGQTEVERALEKIARFGGLLLEIVRQIYAAMKRAIFGLCSRRAAEGGQCQ